MSRSPTSSSLSPLPDRQPSWKQHLAQTMAETSRPDRPQQMGERGAGQVQEEDDGGWTVNYGARDYTERKQRSKRRQSSTTFGIMIGSKYNGSINEQSPSHVSSPLSPAGASLDVLQAAPASVQASKQVDDGGWTVDMPGRAALAPHLSAGIEHSTSSSTITDGGWTKETELKRWVRQVVEASTPEAEAQVEVDSEFVPPPLSPPSRSIDLGDRPSSAQLVLPPITAYVSEDSETDSDNLPTPRGLEDEKDKNLAKRPPTIVSVEYKGVVVDDSPRVPSPQHTHDSSTRRGRGYDSIRRRREQERGNVFWKQSPHPAFNARFADCRVLVKFPFAVRTPAMKDMLIEHVSWAGSVRCVWMIDPQGDTAEKALVVFDAKESVDRFMNDEARNKCLSRAPNRAGTTEIEIETSVAPSTITSKYVYIKVIGVRSDGRSRSASPALRGDRFSKQRNSNMPDQGSTRTKEILPPGVYVDAVPYFKRVRNAIEYEARIRPEHIDFDNLNRRALQEVGSTVHNLNYVDLGRRVPERDFIPLLADYFADITDIIPPTSPAQGWLIAVGGPRDARHIMNEFGKISGILTRWATEEDGLGLERDDHASSGDGLSPFSRFEQHSGGHIARHGSHRELPIVTDNVPAAVTVIVDEENANAAADGPNDASHGLMLSTETPSNHSTKPLKEGGTEVPIQSTKLSPQTPQKPVMQSLRQEFNSPQPDVPRYMPDMERAQTPYDPQYPWLKRRVLPTYKGRVLRQENLAGSDVRFYDDSAVFVGRLVAEQETEETIFARFAKYGRICGIEFRPQPVGTYGSARILYPTEYAAERAIEYENGSISFGSALRLEKRRVLPNDVVLQERYVDDFGRAYSPSMVSQYSPPQEHPEIDPKMSSEPPVHAVNALSPPLSRPPSQRQPRRPNDYSTPRAPPHEAYQQQFGGWMQVPMPPPAPHFVPHTPQAGQVMPNPSFYPILFAMGVGYDPLPTPASDTAFPPFASPAPPSSHPAFVDGHASTPHPPPAVPRSDSPTTSPHAQAAPSTDYPMPMPYVYFEIPPPIAFPSGYGPPPVPVANVPIVLQSQEESPAHTRAPQSVEPAATPLTSPSANGTTEGHSGSGRSQSGIREGSPTITAATSSPKVLEVKEENGMLKVVYDDEDLKRYCQAIGRPHPGSRIKHENQNENDHGSGGSRPPGSHPASSGETSPSLERPAPYTASSPTPPLPPPRLAIAPPSSSNNTTAGSGSSGELDSSRRNSLPSDPTSQYRSTQTIGSGTTRRRGMQSESNTPMPPLRSLPIDIPVPRFGSTATAEREHDHNPILPSAAAQSKDYERYQPIVAEDQPQGQSASPSRRFRLSSVNKIGAGDSGRGMRAWGRIEGSSGSVDAGTGRERFGQDGTEMVETMRGRRMDDAKSPTDDYPHHYQNYPTSILDSAPARNKQFTFAPTPSREMGGSHYPPNSYSPHHSQPPRYSHAQSRPRESQKSTGADGQNGWNERKE